MAGFKGIDAIKSAIDTYATGSSIGFFQLKDDGDRADVQFLHKDADDLFVMLVHKVNIDGKDRYVECLKTYEKPCAYCEQQLKPQLRIFLYVINHSVKEKPVQLWDRGRDQINRILNLINKKKDLRKHVYEIVRNGKKGDASTTYEIDPYDDDDRAISVDNLPDRPDIYEFVFQKDYDEMVTTLKSGAANVNSNYSSGGNQSKGSSGATRRERRTADDDDIPF